MLEERDDGDRTAGALIVGFAAGSLGDLQEITLAAEAAAAAAEACVVVVDGVDGDTGTLRVRDGCGYVGAVLVGDVGAAVIGVDAVGDHQDDTGLVRGLLRLRAGLVFGVRGPVLDEVREAEVGAGAGASQAHGEAQALCCGGAVCGEARHVVSRDDAAVLHEADEDFGTLRQAGDEGFEVIELAADAGAEAVVDEESNLGAVGRDGSEVEEIGGAVVDLEGDVFCGGGDWSLGAQGDQSLGGGGALLLRESSEAGEGECEECQCEDAFCHLGSFLPSAGLDAGERSCGAEEATQVTEKRQDLRGLGGCLSVKHELGNFDARGASVAADSDLHAGADGEGQAGVADGADVLLAEKIVELGEEGDVAGGGEDGVEIELGVGEVEIAVGEEEGVAVVAVVVELEGGVVAAAGDSAFEGGGEAVGGEFGGEEAGAGRAAEGAAADERGEGSDGDAGEVGIEGGGDGVGCEGLVDDGGEVGVAATEEEMVEGPVLEFGFEALGAVGE